MFVGGTTVLLTVLFTKPPSSVLQAVGTTSETVLTGPIDGFRDRMVGQWNNSRQNHGTAGNREASGFMNSAVTVLFMMPPAPWLPAVPQLAWYHS